MNDRTVNLELEDGDDEGERHPHYHCKDRNLMRLTLVACAIGESISRHACPGPFPGTDTSLGV